MNDSSNTLVTIITESSLENFLIKELEELGARGTPFVMLEAKGIGEPAVPVGMMKVISELRYLPMTRCQPISSSNSSISTTKTLP